MLDLGKREEWEGEVTAFARAFAGAFLFGTPLLYTMETWWIGEFADLWKLIVFLGLTFIANFGLASLAGFKRKQGVNATQYLDQAIDAVAVGVIGSVVVLIVLNRIEPGDPLDSVVGKVIVQAIPLSIGASLAGAIFSPSGDRQVGEDSHTPYREWKAVLNDVGATMIGAVLLSFTIAPTEEIPMLSAELQIEHEVALIGFSMFVGYIIVFVSGFDPHAFPVRHPGPLQHPFSETAVAYLVSLLISFGALFLFDQIELSDPVYSNLSQVLVLGLPAMVGGAAGRLAV